MGATVQQFVDGIKTMVDQMVSNIGNAFANMIVHGTTFRHVIKNMFKDMFKDILSSFISMITQMIARWIMFQTLTALFPGSKFIAAMFPGFAKGGYTGDGAKDK
jgi:predicted PurR-regulated permease PerM